MSFLALEDSAEDMSPYTAEEARSIPERLISVSQMPDLRAQLRHRCAGHAAGEGLPGVRGTLSLSRELNAHSPGPEPIHSRKLPAGPSAGFKHPSHLLAGMGTRGLDRAIVAAAFSASLYF